MPFWVNGGRTPPFRLTVASGTISIGSRWGLLSSAGVVNYVTLPWKMAGNFAQADVSKAGLGQYDLAPAQSRLGVVACAVKAGRRGWRLHRDGLFYALTDEATQPDLFADRVPPAVLGDILYFGSWAMDLGTSEILWRLPGGAVTMPVVPADGLVLAVEEGKTLRAFRGRAKR